MAHFQKKRSHETCGPILQCGSVIFRRAVVQAGEPQKSLHKIAAGVYYVREVPQLASNAINKNIPHLCRSRASDRAAMVSLLQFSDGNNVIRE